MAFDPQDLQRTRIGDLDALAKPASPGAPTMVVLHGYGASMSDLAPLAAPLSAQAGLPSGTGWVFADGPVEVPLSPWYSGRAWFPIDVEALQRAAARGAHRDLSGTAPAGLDEARERVFGLLGALGEPLERVVLGGFSQGAMLSTEVAMHLPAPPRALVLLSGALLQADVWRGLAPRRAGLPTFQSHGRLDPVLAFEAAERLHALLADAGWAIDPLEAFAGAHAIPPSVVEALSGFLQRQVAAPGEEA